MASIAAHPLIEVKNLEKHFIQYRGIIRRQKRIIKAVDGVSFHIKFFRNPGACG